MLECSNCGTTREELISQTGLSFDIVGVHQSKNWQVCNKTCMEEWVHKNEVSNTDA